MCTTRSVEGVHHHKPFTSKQFPYFPGDNCAHNEVRPLFRVQAQLILQSYYHVLGLLSATYGLDELLFVRREVGVMRPVFYCSYIMNTETIGHNRKFD